MNAEIQARIPQAPAWVPEDAPERHAYDAAVKVWQAEWAQIVGRGSDDIRIKHGLVRCEDAPGWRKA